jgi:hypothetical protein
MSETDFINQDRRSTRRYVSPLQMRFTYRDQGAEHDGTGYTVDLSCGGVRFQTDDPPPPGAEVELRIPWPLLETNICPLELQVWGKVLRNDSRGTVVLMSRFEFRA